MYFSTIYSTVDRSTNESLSAAAAGYTRPLLARHYAAAVERVAAYTSATRCGQIYS